jgi:hypothetical protein
LFKPAVVVANIKLQVADEEQSRILQIPLIPLVPRRFYPVGRSAWGPGVLKSTTLFPD